MGETGQPEYEVQGGEVTAVGHDEGIEPEAAATTAIVLAGKGVTLGDLLKVNPAVVNTAGIMNSAARVVTDNITLQIVDSLAPITTIHEQLTHLAMQPSILEIVRNAGISGGHVLGDEAFRDGGIASAFSKSETGLNMLRLSENVTMPRLAGGIKAMGAWQEPGESFSQLLGVQADSLSAVHDALVGINRPMEEALESIRGFGMDWDAASSRIYEQIEAEERQRQKAMQSFYSEIDAQQRQRAEAMEATFANIEIWRQQNDEAMRRTAAALDQWRESRSELASRRWGVYEPEELPEQPVTLEDVEMALREGRLSPAELIRLALQHEKSPPGQKLPPWPEIEAICLDYDLHGHLYQNQEAFARKHHISKSTFTRYRQMWRATQGGSLM